MRILKLTITVAGAAVVVIFTIIHLAKAPTGGVEPSSLRVEQRDAPSLKGHPDQFFQYHRDIRTSGSGTLNEYPTGYRIREFEKALRGAKAPVAKLNWSERGPGNVGGRTRAMLVDPDDPNMNTWWAGSVSGGLWKTTDGGNKWRPLTDHLPNLSVSCLAMAESNHDIIYMGTGEGMAGAGAVAGNGIFKSSDRGKTWIHLTATISSDYFRYVNRLAVDPSNPDVVLAATNRGIFRTTDGGDGWERVWNSEGYGFVQDLRAQPSNFDLQIAAVKERGILHSTNAGLDWDFAQVDFVEQPGRIELAYSPSHPDIAYAAADGRTVAQLYRSDNGGLNWMSTKEPTGLNWLGGQGWFDNTIAVHPFRPNTVFVGGIRLWRTVLSGDRTTVSITGKLDDGGSDSWLEFSNIHGPAYNGRAYYLHWEAVDVTEADYSDIEIRFGQGSQKAHRFWVTETAGFYGNGGRDVNLSEYLFADYVEVPFQAWDADNDRQLMISFRDQAYDGEFNLIESYFTSDPGTRDLQSYEFMFVHKYDYDDAIPHSSIATHGGVGTGMLYGLLPVLTSGATWNPDSLPNQTITLEYRQIDSYVRSIDRGIDPGDQTHVDHHGIYPVPIDEARNEFWILNANDGGVAVSTDNGLNFRETDAAFSGYNTSQVYGVAKAPGASYYIAGFQDNGTYQSRYAAASSSRGWREVVGADGIETIWHATDENKILATTQYSAVLRTENRGVGWQIVLPYDVQKGIFVTSIDNSDLAPDDVYSVKRDGVWVSRDFGLTWALKPMRDAWEPWNGCKVRVSIASPDVVWAGCGLTAGQVLHVSRNRALTFEPVALPAITNAPKGSISGLATHPTEDGTAYALFGISSRPKILKTGDYGQTWTDLSGFTSEASSNGFPDVVVYDLIVMPHATNVLWAGTEIGIFVSENGGVEWHYANNGLPAVSVWRMKIRDNEIVVGTHGRGVWTVPISEIDVAAEDALHELSSEFNLRQNYPNPFNASTTIEFTVRQQSHVRLVIFDAAGRKISELTDQVYAPGAHELRWNASAYSAGVYLYHMESNGRLVHARKMTLVK